MIAPIVDSRAVLHVIANRITQLPGIAGGQVRSGQVLHALPLLEAALASFGARRARALPAGAFPAGAARRPGTAVTGSASRPSRWRPAGSA